MINVKKKLFWQIYPSYAIIIILCVIAWSIYSFTSLKTFFYSQVRQSLIEKNQIILPFVQKLMINKAAQSVIDTACINYGGRANVRFTIINRDGVVLGDSNKNPANMENHKNRPEVRAAYADGVGSKIRFSSTLKEGMIYVAIPVFNKSHHPIGILRSSISLAFVDKKLWKINFGIVIAGIIISAIALFIALLFSFKITRPIIDIKKGAEKFAKGDLDSRLYVPEIDELAGLASTLNFMADELNKIFNNEIRQKNELEAVFSSMVEGVIAINENAKILRINQSALDMLGLPMERIRSKYVYEVVRNTELYSFIEKAIEKKMLFSSDLSYGKNREQILNVQSSPIKDEKGNITGNLFVLQDVTRIRYLENVRKDFVANVSHELKTPLTSIKGFTETIMERKNLERETIVKFFSIISKNIERMINIVDDLLDLAWLEKNKGKKSLIFKEEKLSSLIKDIKNICQPLADKKNIKIFTDCNPAITVKINRTIFENALSNLVENAIKYSEKDTRVDILIRREKGNVIISVKDMGIGISTFDQQRIFERFYRVDKGRSRKSGGTGLGLSIVKHIINIHNGRIEVESFQGKGSCFNIYLPV